MISICIRFNTPDQRAQIESWERSEDPIANPSGPEMTESKIARLVRMAQDPNPYIRQRAALDKHTPEAVMEALSRDPDESVRMCVARNSDASCDVLRLAASDSSETVRGWAAINYRIPEDAMEQLAQDISPTVKALVRWKQSLKEETP